MEFIKANKVHLHQLAKLRGEFQREEAASTVLISETAFLENCLLFLEKGLVSGQWVFWIAIQNKIIIAHTFVCLVDMIPKPHRIIDRYGYLTNTYTKPAYRNRGIGSQLLTVIKDWAREVDLEVLIVWPSEKSTSFYNRAGFSLENEVMELVLRKDEDL